MFLPSDFSVVFSSCSFQDGLAFMQQVCEKPPYARVGGTTCFSPVLAAFWVLRSTSQPSCAIAAPFASKTASFCSLLKIAVSLQPEDAVTHVIAKRKKGYFFCFRLWEKSCRATSAPARVMLAPAWASRPRRRPSGSGVPSRATAARQRLEMQVPCRSAHRLFALEGRCAGTAAAKYEPGDGKSWLLARGGFEQSSPRDEGVSYKL